MINPLVIIGEAKAKDGKSYGLYSGLTKRLAEHWAEYISADDEVRKWTQDYNKRSTPEDILRKNDPNDETKRLVTYSVWDGDPETEGNLVAVAWFQVWEAGENELSAIKSHLNDLGLNPEEVILVTCAFRVAANYRGQGLATDISRKSEQDYVNFLSEIYGEKKKVFLTLETDENNEPAVNLYKKLNYKLLGAFEQDREEYRGRRLLMGKFLD